MELWEIQARAQITALVIAYNACGDRGHFNELLDLFTPDATMDISDGHLYKGREEIKRIFTTTSDSLKSDGDPILLQHHTSLVHVIFENSHSATGQAYFSVMTGTGIDHWGRYNDSYLRKEDTWKFHSRQVQVDGQTPGGWADLNHRSTR